MPALPDVSYQMSSHFANRSFRRVVNQTAILFPEKQTGICSFVIQRKFQCHILFTETTAYRNNACWPDDPHKPNAKAMVRPRFAGVSAATVEEFNVGSLRWMSPEHQRLLCFFNLTVVLGRYAAVLSWVLIYWIHIQQMCTYFNTAKLMLDQLLIGMK